MTAAQDWVVIVYNGSDVIEGLINDQYTDFVRPSIHLLPPPHLHRHARGDNHVIKVLNLSAIISTSTFDPSPPDAPLTQHSKKTPVRVAP